MYTMGKNIREGDRMYYLGKLRKIIKVTPMFHSVVLVFEDTTDEYQTGDQTWFHVERDDES